MLLCERTHIKYDLDDIRRTYESINDLLHTKEQWYNGLQTALQYAEKSDDHYQDACGSFSKRIAPDLGIKTQQEFCHLNPEYKGTIFEEILEEHKAFRTRLMWRKIQTTYSVHYDMDKWRYHIALITNPHAYLIYPKGFRKLYLKQGLTPPTQDQIFHMPADGYVYRMRTSVPHTVVNCGNEDRLHLAWGSDHEFF